MPLPSVTCNLLRNVPFSSNCDTFCQSQDTYLDEICRNCSRNLCFGPLMLIDLCFLNGLDCLNVLSIGIFLDLVVGNLLGLLVVHHGLHVGGLFLDSIGRTRHLLQILATELVTTRSCHSKTFVMPQACVTFSRPSLLLCRWPWLCPVSNLGAAAAFCVLLCRRDWQ